MATWYGGPREFQVAIGQIQEVTPEQLAALLRQSATATPNPVALSAVGATFEKEVDADED